MLIEDLIAELTAFQKAGKDRVFIRAATSWIPKEITGVDTDKDGDVILTYNSRV